MTSLKQSDRKVLLFGRSSFFDERSARRDHVEGFTNLIKYLTRLRREAVIDDNVFKALIKYASTAFIEAELEERIERVLEKKLSSDLLLDVLK